MKVVAPNAIDCSDFNKVYDEATALRDSGAEEAAILAFISEQLPSAIISPLEIERMKGRGRLHVISAGPMSNNDGDVSPSRKPN